MGRLPALRTEGCDVIYREKASGASRAGPSFGVRSPVLAQRFESLELVVIEFGQIARGAVVKELEDLVHGLLPSRWHKSLGAALSVALSSVRP
jgi:hypothetical protein